MNPKSHSFHDMEKVLRRAGELMLSYNDPAVYQKGGHANFVSEADIAVQEMVRTELLRLFPEAAFMGEEGDEHTLTDRMTFVVDPIDGTTNFLRHRCCSVISAAVLENKKPVFGMIYDPYADTLFRAEENGGAFRNGESIRVSDVPAESALIALGTSPYLTELSDRTGESLKRILREFGDVRRSGSAAYDLCDIACGRIDGMFEWALQPWDYCAGTLIIREAGGIAGSITGGDIGLTLNSPFMAATERVYDRLQRLLQEVARE